ncbi:DUF1642 domain-containing protein [Enterococcus faecium]|nr:DUF1642 domain-containing protein [Enterococcus faecium]
MNKNKQELIRKWENKTEAPAYEISDLPINSSKIEMYIAGYGVARSEIIEDLKQLDEPRKPVVPKFVANWYEHHKDNIEFCIQHYLRCFKFQPNDEFKAFMDDLSNKPIETLIRMKDGYVVEKEPLYMVPLLTDKEGNKKILVERRGEYDIIWDYENEGDWHELLTDEQIKSVNSDYWKFAVIYEPSEEVAAG